MVGSLRGVLVLCASVLTVSFVEASESLRFDFSPDPLARFQHKAALRLTCPTARVRPKVDGRLDDAAWRTAARVDRLSRPKPATTVRLCADADALYIGVTCQNPASRAARAKQHEHDGPVYRDDCVEVWLQPDRARVVSYQFIVNAANSAYEAMRFAGRSKVGHNPAWRHAVQSDKTSWTVEMAIPFAAIGLDGPRRELGFNIGRNGPGVGARSWSAKYGHAHASVLVMPDAPEAPVVRRAAAAATADARVLTDGKSLRVGFERLEARAGERWLEGVVAVCPTTAPLAEGRVCASLFRPGDQKPVDRGEAAVTRDRGTLAVDLRRHGLVRAELLVELFEGDARTGLVKVFLSASEPKARPKAGTKVPVRIDLPEGVDRAPGWPLTFGVPIPAGVLWDAEGLRVVDAKGRELPAQKEVTGRWAREGAVKWVRIDTLAPGAGGCSVQFTPPAGKVALASPVTVTRRGDDLVVDTGAARYVLGRGASPVKEIRLGGRLVASSRGARGLYAIDQKGELATASADGETMRVESSGPVAACVRFEGFYKTKAGRDLARHITRVELFAGQAFARVTHTFTLINDTNAVWFKDIGWELAAAPGAESNAWFGVSRDDWRQVRQAPIAGGKVAMLQDSHYRHGHGKNHFSVTRQDADGKAESILEGEECGDWAALAGADGGLMIACREAARQHPKEFVASAEKLLLRLFSPRAGEELDFRMPALVKRWDLKTWHEKSTSKHRRGPILERALANKSNAVGWSKTHYLTLAPLAAKAQPADAARLARLACAQVYAHVAPEWVCASGAMGPIHPKDVQRFADAETAMDAAFRYWEQRLDTWGDYGFVDYFNGPHLSYRGKYVIQKRYSKSTYTLKPDLWLQYARSGSRHIRTFIENVARTFMDVDVAQWDGDGRIRGLCHSVGGGDLSLGHRNNLPMPWAGAATFHYSSATNLNLVAWDYYLTGNRRAKDVMFEFADGAKRLWTPQAAARDWRVLMLLRTLVQTYAFTWDPTLLAMAEATTDQFHDPGCELDLTKNRPYSSTYKTQVDLRAIEDAWQVLGGRRYRTMLLKMARRWWGPLLGAWPHFYCNPQGRCGAVLYEATGAAHIPQALAVQARYSASAYDPETKHTAGCEGASKCTFIFEGLPYAMALMASTNADREPTASWVGYEDFGYASSVVVWKGDEQAIDLRFPTARNAAPPAADVLRSAVDVTLAGSQTRYGLDVHRLVRTSAGDVCVRLPKDAPEGAYVLRPKATGMHICFADSRVPMVIHAPRYWRPAPEQRPAVRYYFKLPTGEAAGQIFFEGSARLFDPQGRPWPEAKAQRGWVSLPADKPGLWSFVPVGNEIVGSRNIPPFFAVESASSYFQPAIPWQRRPAVAVERPDPKQVFAPGAIARLGDQGLHLTGKRVLRLAGGAAHPSGDGRRFLPFKQGTIEFWMKPSWHTCALQPKGFKRLVTVGVAKGAQWTLSHTVAPRARNAWNDFLFSHVLYGWLYSDGLAKRTTLRRYRRTLFEPGQWTHVAWVWGARDGLVPRNPPYHTKVRDGVLTSAIYVNGKQGSHWGYRWYKNLPSDEPVWLEIGRGYASANIDAIVDELRVSDVQRYTGDFEPMRRAPFEMDDHTRALFHFNGDTVGSSAGHNGPLPAKLTP